MSPDPVPARGPAEGDDAPRPARLTRRRLLQSGAAAAGAAALAPLLPGRAWAADAPGPGAAAHADVPPPQSLTAVSVSPPGASGFFSIAGEAAGKASGNPADYGAHVDDQRDLYWGFGYKPASFAAPAGTPVHPTPGSRLYRDGYGVPIVYGDTAADVWFAVGYAFAQDRLFEMDAIRRMAQGTLAELSGPTQVPADVQARVLGYTAAEYDAMYTGLLGPEDRVAIDGCVAGINAWIDQVLLDPATLLPAEYAVLSSLPTTWVRNDVLATGVFLVRSIAVAGGNELTNVANLATLQEAYPTDVARGLFTDLYWLNDGRAVTTVPAASGSFPNSDVPAAAQAAAFDRLADWAVDLPAGLDAGPGTGAYPVPSAVPAAAAADPADVAALHALLPEQARAGVARAVATLQAWGAALHGGSYQYAVAPWRSATGAALLANGPQLAYSYPSELYELEVHGGGYDARGATVPGLPVVGIGFGTRIAWGLTTGYSKTIDTFIETVRTDPVTGAPQYLFDGEWVDQDTRTETVYYRPAPDGVPVGPPVESVSVQVCRTHHGPVVATAGDAANAQAYAVWGREVQTISGLLRWNRADDLEEFAAGVAEVTWNENVLYADADGNIAYWHPGLYPRRAAGTDLRLPTPGTGSHEWDGFLPFARMPHALNPAQGYLANWNTKPAVGWDEGTGVAGVAPAYPPGAAQRVQDITRMLEHQRNVTAADMAAIDRFIGIADHRARAFVPLVLRLASLRHLSAVEAKALERLAVWDHCAYDPPPGTVLGLTPGTTDSPAATVFDAFMAALRSTVLGFLPAAVLGGDEQPSQHLFDVEPADNLVLRILEPSTSSLTPSYDYLAGRSVDDVLRAALEAACSALAAQYGTDDVAAWRRPHPTSSVDSLTGVVGPSLTMPFEDRGTYIQQVAFTRR